MANASRWRLLPRRHRERFALAMLSGQEVPKPVLNVVWRPDRPLQLQLHLHLQLWRLSCS